MILLDSYIFPISLLGISYTRGKIFLFYLFLGWPIIIFIYDDKKPASNAIIFLTICFCNQIAIKKWKCYHFMKWYIYFFRVLFVNVRIFKKYFNTITIAY